MYYTKSHRYVCAAKHCSEIFTLRNFVLWVFIIFLRLDTGGDKQAGSGSHLESVELLLLLPTKQEFSKIEVFIYRELSS
jgi:hypothetical protein